MKMFSSCSGECCVCSCESCLAGHGDDDFSVATAEQIIKRLNKGQYPDYREYMINFLKDHYNIVYDNTMDEQTRKQLTNDILNGTRQLVALSKPIANLTKELDEILKDFERQTIEKVLFSVLIRFYFADWTRACDYEKMTSEEVVEAVMEACKEIEKEFNYDFDEDITPDPFYDEVE